MLCKHNKSMNHLTGVYIKFEIHISAPPPTLLDLYFFPNEIHYNEGVHAACEKCQPFFVAILYILRQLGKKYAFPPFF